MKFAHKFGVGPSLKTSLTKNFTPPLKNLAGENVKFRRTFADPPSIGSA